jgi:outer membrane lipoprotein carrier protein
MRPIVPALALSLALAGSFLAGRPAIAQSSPAAQGGPTALQIAARVQSFYDQTRTFQADFKQEYTVKMHNQTKTSEGHVVFEKPGKMSWTYRQPTGNRVVSDGKTLRIYEKSNAQMFEQQVDKSQYPAALAFLMGEGSLEKAFDLRIVDAKFEGGWVLEGTPKDATPAYRKVLLYVDGATSQVRRVLIVDAQGNRNRFDFSNPVVNTKVGAAEFQFQAPPGTQIVKP